MCIVICKDYAILYKGLEHPWILVSTGVLEPIPKDTNCTVAQGALFPHQAAIHSKASVPLDHSKLLVYTGGQLDHKAGLF